MYPGTIVNWHDQSAIQTRTVQAVDNSPLYLCLSSFDRGPEELTVVSTKFYDLYGSKMNFDKHGQPAIQAANMIDNGARLLVKRLVADDAKLANLIGVATVSRNIVAINAADDDPNAKTIDEILGNDPEPKEYAEELSIVSTIGDTADTTKLAVTPALTEGNSYYWIATEDQMMPELDTVIVTANYVYWDGTSDISVPRGTQIRLVEVDAENKIKKCGIIEAYSRIVRGANQQTSLSVDFPDTDIESATATASEGTNVGDSTIDISDEMGDGETYYYIPFVDFVQLMGDQVPTTDTRWTAEDIETYFTNFGTELVKDITTGVTDPDNEKKLVFIKMVQNEDESYSPVKGFSLVTCTKGEPDTGSTESIDPIIPSASKYLVDAESSSATIKWSAVSIANCAKMKDVEEEANKLFIENEPDVKPITNGISITTSADYPLICMGDNGRGLSNKSFKIYSDNIVSKDMNSMFYVVNIFDGTQRIERVTVALDPSLTYNNNLYGINLDSAMQVKMFNVEGAYEAYVDTLSDISGLSIEELNKYNLIKAVNSRGESIPGITYDTEGIDFGSAYGVNLENGDNGAFGDVPFGTEAYINEAVKVLDGTYDDAIWDVDQYKICAVFDANYPVEIKEAIATFVEFREDCVFFRDYCTDVDSYASIMEFRNQQEIALHSNKFIADYYTTYQIYNPETRKRIRVTMLYDLAATMVGHFNNGCYRPVAGVANNMILRNAIEGTINFTPRITPKVNQKELLDTARINYAIFENGVCVVQSTYSSQNEFTQLSFINNVMAVQEVVRAIRVACPKSRYTFTTATDFTFYADAVKEVLSGFVNHFAELTFEYEQDPLQAVQKIFYAELYFRFNNWAQTEKFDIYTLGNE